MASEKEADKLMKQAEKLLRPSMLSMRFKPDWDDAYPLYEKAAVQYKVLGLSEKAISAFEKGAEANVRGHGTAWHAGKHLESAAQISCELQNWKAAADFVRQAASHYIDCGKVSTAAECLGRGARQLEGADLAESGKLYKEAVETYAEDSLAASAHDLVQRGVGVLIRGEAWDDAASLLMQWGSICLSGHNDSYLCRAYLGVIVIYLYAGNVEAAWASYQDFLDVDQFSNSAEAMAAENVFEAYCAGDAASIQQRISSARIWTTLDAQVARLAKQIPSKNCNLATMASKLQPLMGGPAYVHAPEGDDGELDLT